MNSPYDVQFVFGGHFGPSPFFNKSFHGIKLFILARLEAFGVMQDKPVVIGVTKFPIDYSFAWAIARYLLHGGSTKTRTLRHGTITYRYILFDAKDFVDQGRLAASCLKRIEWRSKNLHSW